MGGEHNCLEKPKTSCKRGREAGGEEDTDERTRHTKKTQTQALERELVYKRKQKKGWWGRNLLGKLVPEGLFNLVCIVI